MSVNQISALEQIVVKPAAWRVTQNIDACYMLEFTYVAPERLEWSHVVLQRTGIKVYKSIKAVIHDIRRVQDDAVVFFNFK